jgi:L-asparaginase / beta-aspartyl-peptidase
MKGDHVVSIILHGGASNFAPEKRIAVQQACAAVIQAGYQLLTQGARALDTVEQVIRLLEDNPLFDAGTGSSPNSDGEIEMDAMIMDGKTLNFGAVGGIKNVKHPVSVARRVMDQTQYCFLTGEGACRFARAQQFEYVSTSVLKGESCGEANLGTVGVIALDEAGNIAVATSTGGAPSKMPGRIGDSPLIGCGTVADNLTGAAAASGHGEALMKIRISDYVLGLMRGGANPSSAAKLSIKCLEERVDGKGGLICMSNRGEIGYAFNTPDMAIAYIDAAGERKVLM